MQMIRTKIVATMGPACSSADMLFHLFETGVDVCRLNFSHGSLDEHLLMLRNIREAAARWDQPIAIIPRRGAEHRPHTAIRWGVPQCVSSFLLLRTLSCRIT